MISNSIKFFAAFGKTDYFRGGEEGLNKLGFWNFFSSEGIKPYGYLFSLAYRYAIFPDPNIPVFGDCGARSYRFEEIPTLRGQRVTAQWAVQEYSSYLKEHCRERYLVAPDHLLMESLSSKELESRREFNWTNAANFLPLTKGWFNTTAIAVAHGVTTEERISSAQSLIEMGYKAIGLGGLVGIGSVKYTLSIVKALVEALPPEIHIHVFGLCSPAYVKEFANLGINSFDGSTHLREGFKGVFLEAIEGQLRRHRCHSVMDRITIPSCTCAPCWLLSKMGIEPRLSNNRANNLGRVVHNLEALTRSHRQATLSRRIVLVACVAKKRLSASPAKELYCSQWFRTACRYAKATGAEVYFLSARHGLVHPDQVLEPYECDPKHRGKSKTLQWQAMVVNQLKELAPVGAQFTIIGRKAYYKGVKEPLEKLGLYAVSTPLAGLGIGWQLNWLINHTPRYEQLSLGLVENCA